MPNKKVKTQKAKIKILIHRFNLKNFLGVIFIIFGFLLLYKFPTISQKPQSREPIHASSEFEKKSSDPSVVRILLPKENIDLSVTAAKIVGGYWQTSETTASQGEGTSNPGKGGNVVIFAHARVGLFYNLKDVKKGEIVYVFTKNNWYRYMVADIQKVYPANVTVVAPTKKEELTLFTCSGFFDEQRLIVKAIPV